MAEIAAEARPRLAPGVRLHHDAARDAWMLLAPERVIETEGPAQAILSRCDGTRTLAAIVAELAEAFTAPPAEIEADVREMLGELIGKRLVVLA